jgi:hypothetical protein
LAACCWRRGGLHLQCRPQARIQQLGLTVDRVGGEEHHLDGEAVLGWNGLRIARLAVGVEVLDEQVAIPMHGVAAIHGCVRHIGTRRKLEPTRGGVRSF